MSFNSMPKAELIKKLKEFNYYTSYDEVSVDWYFCCSRCCTILGGKYDWEDCYEVCYLYESENIKKMVRKYA